MSDWALSTNLYTWAQVEDGFFSWPVHQAESDVIRGLRPGDWIVPKYAQSPAYGDEAADELQATYCSTILVDYEKALKRYLEIVANGAGAVPHLLRVTSDPDEDTRPSNGPWARVRVEPVPLRAPFSTKEFLRLRAVPPPVAAQFKGSVSPGRHLQPLPPHAAARIRQAGSDPNRGDALRRYSLVRAADPAEARELLVTADRAPITGDRLFLATSGGLPGVFDVTDDGVPKSVGAPIRRQPDQLLELFAEAQRKATSADHFSAANAIAACNELQALLDGVPDVLPVDDFQRWHDRYELLPAKVTAADELARRAEPIVAPSPPLEQVSNEEGDAEADEAVALVGLSIEAVRAELPPEMVIPDSVLKEVVTAVRAGKHLLLGGPPGTGKSTIAEAVCRAVVGNSYDVTTATADWTTFDTIGGYLPERDGVTFVPGVVLSALRGGRWLVIDELNRADIDKAFGSLFTLLNGANSAATRRATLPYRDRGEKPITIEWAERRGDSDYVITDHWRMIGTLNVADKASLFQLSFAFLRRFAVIDVPVPDEESYGALVETLFADVPTPAREQIETAALKVAFGPRAVGPAITTDIARFVARAIDPIAGGPSTYADPVEAFAVAVKLMVVPQYEGADVAEGGKLVTALSLIWPERDDDLWSPLRTALHSVALQ